MSGHKYQDVNCCEWTRGVDNQLQRYADDRDEIVQLMEEDPEKLVTVMWQRDGPLSIDSDCLCQMGAGIPRSPFACAQCTNLRRLIDFRQLTVNREFPLECGERAGDSLIIRSTSVPRPFLRWDVNASRRAQQYMAQYEELQNCGTPVNVGDLRMVTGDSFTTSILIQWMLYQRFDDNGLPHIPLLETGYICRETGYTVHQVPGIGLLSDLHTIDDHHDIPREEQSMKSQNFSTNRLKSEVTRTMIVQLLVTLRELSEVNFSHGAPSVNSLLFSNIPVSYRYDGVHVQGPITLQIANFTHSSATFSNVHYFPSDTEAEMNLSRSPFVPQIESRCVSEENAVCQDSATFYRLTQSTSGIYQALRHLGFPLYVGSFDFYAFMVALMCDHSFYQSVRHDPQLYYLWSLMWTVEDKDPVEEKIRQVHASEYNPEDTPALDILRGAWLRCDILPYMWALIQNGQ